MDVRRAGLRLTWLGAGAQAAGLGVDAWLHGRDSGLAAREGPFTLTNTGHSLLVGGIGLVILGAFMSMMARCTPTNQCLPMCATSCRTS